MAKGAVLEALVLADSFDTFHRPLSLDRPRALFPLVNVPLLDYTLALLAANGVTSAYLYTSAHAGALRSYTQAARTDLTLEVIESRAALNAGDALRDLYRRGDVLRNDFVLVSGDVVAAVDLAPLLAAHRKARHADREVLLTQLLAHALPCHPLRTPQDALRVAIDVDTGRLLAWETQANARAVALPVGADKPAARVRRLAMRSDVMDCRIAVCAPEVLQQFSDNFDYADVAALVRGVVAEEILDAKVHAHVLGPKDGFAARVHTWQQYRRLTHAIVQRWTYPLVPDLAASVQYRSLRGGVYLERGVSLSRTATIGRSVVLGAGVSIGAHSHVERSVLGRGCVVGENVRIADSVLWDDVCIESHASVYTAVIGDRAFIATGVHVPRGALVGSDVRVGPGTRLEPRVRLTAHEASGDAAELGEQGRGFVWKGVDVGARYDDEREVEELSVESEDEDDNHAVTDKAPAVYESRNARFVREVSETVARAHEAAQGGAVNQDSVRLEVNSLKLVYDVDFLFVAEALLIALLDLERDAEDQHWLDAVASWASLIARVYLPAPRLDDELQLLDHLASACAATSWCRRYELVIRGLHGARIISARSLVAWKADVLAASDNEGDSDDEDAQIRDLCMQCAEYIDSLAPGMEVDSPVASADEADTSGWFAARNEEDGFWGSDNSFDESDSDSA